MFSDFDSETFVLDIKEVPKMAQHPIARQRAMLVKETMYSYGTDIRTIEMGSRPYYYSSVGCRGLVRTMRRESNSGCAISF